MSMQTIWFKINTRIACVFWRLIILVSVMIMFSISASAKSIEKLYGEIESIEIRISTNLDREQDFVFRENFFNNSLISNKYSEFEIFRNGKNEEFDSRLVTDFRFIISVKEKCDSNFPVCAYVVFPFSYWNGDKHLQNHCREIILTSKISNKEGVSSLSNRIAKLIHDCFLMDLSDIRRMKLEGVFERKSK